MIEEVEDMDGLFYIRNSKVAYGEDDVVAIPRNNWITLGFYSAVGGDNRVKFVSFS